MFLSTYVILNLKSSLRTNIVYRLYIDLFLILYYDSSLYCFPLIYTLRMTQHEQKRMFICKNITEELQYNVILAKKILLFVALFSNIVFVNFYI